jgi:hypothetical protein
MNLEGLLYLLAELKGAIGTLPIAGGGTGSTSTTYCDLTANVTGVLPNANVAADLTITAGTINNTPIGSSSQSTIRGTTIDASTDFTIGTTVITDDSVAMNSGIINCSGTAEVAGTTVTLDSAANIELEVGATTNYVQTTGIFRGGNIGSISDTLLPVTLTEFTLSDSSSGDHVYTTTNGSRGFCTDIAQLYYASVVIPNGYTASACIVYGADLSRSSTFKVYESSVSGATPSLVGTMGFGRGVNFSSNIVGDGTKTCIIELNWNHAGDFVAGAGITIAKT